MEHRQNQAMTRRCGKCGGTNRACFEIGAAPASIDGTAWRRTIPRSSWITIWRPIGGWLPSDAGQCRRVGSVSQQGERRNLNSAFERPDHPAMEGPDEHGQFGYWLLQ